MAVWQRANPIIQQKSFTMVRAKGDFIMFDRVELMFKWWYTLQGTHNFSLREKCPNPGFFWSVFSCIWTEYRNLRDKSPYSVRIQENTDQKKFRIWNTFHGVFLSSNKQSTYLWWLMLFLTTFFFFFFPTPFVFFISSFFVFIEYIFTLKTTNSSIISPFNSSFILPIIVLFPPSSNRLSFLYPEKLNKYLSALKSSYTLSI